MTVQEATIWLLHAASACVQDGDWLGQSIVLGAMNTPLDADMLDAAAEEYELGAAATRRDGTTEQHARDARILCFCAAVLRAVDKGAL